MPKVPPVGAVANRAYGVRVASILPNTYKTDANARIPTYGVRIASILPTSYNTTKSRVCQLF